MANKQGKMVSSPQIVTLRFGVAATANVVIAKSRETLLPLKYLEIPKSTQLTDLQ